jgi:hypothetical protein
MSNFKKAQRIRRRNQELIREKLDQLHHELAQQSSERIQALCDDELNQDSDNPSIEPKVDSQIEP